VGIYQAISAAVIACAIIAAVTVLTWHGSINGEAAVAIFSTIIGGAGTATVAHVATRNGASQVAAATASTLDRTVRQPSV
jgi:uncharacterized membrane protein